jgi:methylenetetrahydrofolate reductase (NADPH)
VEGNLKRLPWCAHLDEETKPMKGPLSTLNQSGFLTINSQPRVNAAPSDDDVHGWGGPGGYVYQKAYVEFFCSSENLTALKDALAAYPSMRYSACDAKGAFETSSTSNVTAVTWGVFPDREVVQPTVVSKDAFLVWKDEAFGLWLSQWKSIYEEGSESAKLVQSVHDSYWLVTIVDHDYINGNIFSVFNSAIANLPKK